MIDGVPDALLGLGGGLEFGDFFLWELAFGVAVDGDGFFADPIEDAIVEADVDAGVALGILRFVDEADLAIAEAFGLVDEQAMPRPSGWALMESPSTMNWPQPMWAQSSEILLSLMRGRVRQGRSGAAAKR